MEDKLLCSLHVKCLMVFFFSLSLPLVVVFKGHRGYNHNNILSVVILSCMLDSTNEEYLFLKKKTRTNIYLALTWSICA